MATDRTVISCWKACEDGGRCLHIELKISTRQFQIMEFEVDKKPKYI